MKPQIAVPVILSLCLAVSEASAGKKMCCPCRGGGPPGDWSATTVPGDNCKMKCSISGGTVRGQPWLIDDSEQCTPNPPGPKSAPCPMDVIAGNCKGNNWCDCKLKVAVKGPGVVGQEVTVDLIVTNRVGHVDGTYRTVVDSGGAVWWGDGVEDKIPGVDSVTRGHVYKQPGKYKIKGRIGGQFKWSANDGSCSFYCFAEGEQEVTVTAPSAPGKGTNPK